ncbi:Yip1 family protein [Nissabacter sp. SGAir0207]|uniref:Yip1 family protein n=1 Tax=Nissabacter sp. SGAir0207 TaxID=2126321 RepID=UPI00143D3885|nr:Yip1 family protein [Nissabacter sp. SGAir0207]
MNHVWGLFAHPGPELQQIKREHESIGHLYLHHVLLMAAIPVVCSFIGTTRVGWSFGDGDYLRILPSTALAIALAFYLLMLGAVALMGRVIHMLSRRFPSRPSLNECIVFAGYVATPMFLSGVVALYPVVWLCLFVGILALVYSGYLLYLGMPAFLGVNKDEGVLISGSTLGIGVLVLEFVLALTVIMWGYGAHIF